MYSATGKLLVRFNVRYWKCTHSRRQCTSCNVI